MKKVTQLVKQNLHPRGISLMPIQASSANNSIDLTDEEESVTRPQNSNPPALVAMSNQAQQLAKQNMGANLKQTSHNTVAYIMKPNNEAGKQIHVNRVQQQQQQYRSEFLKF